MTDVVLDMTYSATQLHLEASPSLCTTSPMLQHPTALQVQGFFPFRRLNAITAGFQEKHAYSLHKTPWFRVPGSQQLHRDPDVSNALNLAQQVHCVLEAPREAPSAVLRYAVQGKWDHIGLQERHENSHARAPLGAEAENRALGCAYARRVRPWDNVSTAFR